MKNSILVSVLISFVFYGCQNESITSDSLDEYNFTQPNPEYLYTLDAIDPSLPYERVDNTAFLNITDQTNRNPNAHAHGHYTGGTPVNPDDDRFYQSISIDFNATKNSQGTNGFAHFTINWGENTEYVWEFNTIAEELSVEDNEAVYCGFVTSESGDRPFNLEGSRIWFRVIDEGRQGNNSNPDRYYDGLFFTSHLRTRCDAFLCGSIIWQYMDQREVEYENDRIIIN